ncbi:MAG: IgA Peptidase M64 [Prevotella sp.]|nr:IgA Peptidase M64 [Prevotella sp.]
MKYRFLILCLLVSCLADAQDFDDSFVDKTLRIDYTFSGNATTQMVSVDELSTFDGWFGKRKRLSEVPVEGNGQIIVRKHRSGDVIYRNSFSTLFQEWLSYDEAKEKSRSFENVFLVPMPKDTVDITVRLMDNRRETMTTMTHTVVPTDILIRRLAKGGTTPYDVLQSPADSARCIRIAFVAEGYKKDEMPVFLNDARIAVEALFAHEPFKSFRDCFSIVAVKSPSVDSGTSEPGNGKWLNTALHSNFDTFYSDRYLTTLHLKDLHNWLAGIPYEHIIVLVNTDKYGGGGILNSYNLAMAHHPKYRPVVVHEFGHSFAGLADEYAYETEGIPMYPLEVEPWEKNITTNVDFTGKWENLIGKDPTVGKFEGAGYSLKGVYRACKDCRMRTNENPDFCPACKQAITNLIRFYTE